MLPSAADWPSSPGLIASVHFSHVFGEAVAYVHLYAVSVPPLNVVPAGNAVWYQSDVVAGLVAAVAVAGTFAGFGVSDDAKNSKCAPPMIDPETVPWMSVPSPLGAFAPPTVVN